MKSKLSILLTLLSSNILSSETHLISPTFAFDKFINFDVSNNIFVGLDQYNQTFSIGSNLSKNFKISSSFSNDLFGSSGGEGATSIRNGNTVYMQASYQKNNFNTSLTYGVGKASVGGMFSDLDTVHGIGYDLNYNTNNFSFGVKVPLKVVKGSITSNVPIKRGMDGSIEYLLERNNLSPSETQLDLYTNYKYEINNGHNGHIDLYTSYVQNEFNVANEDDIVSNISYNYAF